MRYFGEPMRPGYTWTCHKEFVEGLFLIDKELQVTLCVHHLLPNGFYAEVFLVKSSLLPVL